MQVVQLLRHVPNAAENDKIVVIDIRGVTASLERNLTLRLDFDPLLVSDVVDPKITELLRAIILTAKDIHVAIEDRG